MIESPNFVEHWQCNHARSEIRRRDISGDPRPWLQCLDCGSGIRAVKKADAGDLKSLPPYDLRLAESYRQEKSEAWNRIVEEHREQRDQQRKEEFKAWQNSYLSTPEWKERRRLVFERCKGVCEGCRKAPATEVHHLTYDNMGNEFLWELVGICRPCHQRETEARRARNAEAI